MYTLPKPYFSLPCLFHPFLFIPIQTFFSCHFIHFPSLSVPTFPPFPFFLVPSIFFFFSYNPFSWKFSLKSSSGRVRMKVCAQAPRFCPQLYALCITGGIQYFHTYKIGICPQHIFFEGVSACPRLPVDPPLQSYIR